MALVTQVDANEFQIKRITREQLMILAVALSELQELIEADVATTAYQFGDAEAAKLQDRLDDVVEVLSPIAFTAQLLIEQTETQQVEQTQPVAQAPQTGSGETTAGGTYNAALKAGAGMCQCEFCVAKRAQ